MNGLVRSDFFFLPEWPPSGTAVFWVSLTIVLAGLLGELAYRRFSLPRVVGYAGVGTIVSLFGVGLGTRLDPSLRLIVDLALALLLFEMGSRINLRWLRTNPWLLATSIAEAALTFVAVQLTLVWLGMDTRTAAAAAAISIATSPSVVMRVTSELNASGQVSERLMLLSGLNTLYAVLATNVVLGWLHAEYSGSWATTVAHPLYLLGGSAIVAALLALAVSLLARRLALANENATLLLLGLILLALAITKIANLSTLMVPLLAGLILRNSTERPWIWPRHFGTAGGVLVLLLFVITGAVWSIDLLATGIMLGLALILARVIAKMLVVTALSRPSGISVREGIALGAAMAPMSGAALILMAELQMLYPDFAAALAGAMFSAMAVLELLGPIVVHVALRKVREDNIP
jgi:Kef-type K+ transport system membrane component KefB